MPSRKQWLKQADEYQKKAEEMAEKEPALSDFYWQKASSSRFASDYALVEQEGDERKDVS